MNVIKFSAKRLFFDRPAVTRLIDKKTAKALSRVGAFIRTRARSSLRRRKSPSRPGTPPSVHSRSAVASLKNIWFVYDPARRSVVVGPIKLNQVTFTLSGNQTVPEIMEGGGTVGIREWRFSNLERIAGQPGWQRYVTTRKFTNEWRRADLRWRNASRHRQGFYLSQLGVEQRTRNATYPARPFMGPAYQAEKPNIPRRFGGSA